MRVLVEGLGSGLTASFLSRRVNGGPGCKTASPAGRNVVSAVMILLRGAIFRKLCGEDRAI